MQMAAYEHFKVLTINTLKQLLEKRDTGPAFYPTNSAIYGFAKPRAQSIWAYYKQSTSTNRCTSTAISSLEIIGFWFPLPCTYPTQGGIAN